MGVTNVTINGLVIHEDTHYATGADTLTMLEAMAPNDPVLVDMANRHPVYIRSQVGARPITLVVYFIQPDANDRKADYDALLTTIDPSTGVLKTLSWTDGGTTKSLQIVASSLVPARWFASASAELVAPNPQPTIS